MMLEWCACLNIVRAIIWKIKYFPLDVEKYETRFHLYLYQNTISMELVHITLISWGLLPHNSIQESQITLCPKGFLKQTPNFSRYFTRWLNTVHKVKME